MNFTTSAWCFWFVALNIIAKDISEGSVAPTQHTSAIIFPVHTFGTWVKYNVIKAFEEQVNSDIVLLYIKEDLSPGQEELLVRFTQDMSSVKVVAYSREALVREYGDKGYSSFSSQSDSAQRLAAIDMVLTIESKGPAKQASEERSTKLSDDAKYTYPDGAWVVHSQAVFTGPWRLLVENFQSFDSDLIVPGQEVAASDAENQALWADCSICKKPVDRVAYLLPVFRISTKLAREVLRRFVAKGTGPMEAVVPSICLQLANRHTSTDRCTTSHIGEEWLGSPQNWVLGHVPQQEDQNSQTQPNKLYYPFNSPA